MTGADYFSEAHKSPERPDRTGTVVKICGAALIAALVVFRRGYHKISYAIDIRDFLPTVVKRIIWNRKYKKGYGFKDAPLDVLPLLKDKENILELGCGYGAMLAALKSSGWKGTYVGVDISEVAIRKNREVFPCEEWWAESIESYKPPLGHDAVCFLESLYYVSLDKAGEVIRGSYEALLPDGELIFRFHDADKYKKYVEKIIQLFPGSEQRTVGVGVVISIRKSQ